MFKVRIIRTRMFIYHCCCRLYNGLCGELISSSDELEGSCVEVFRNSSAIEQFGVWTQHGVWIVRVSSAPVVVLK